ncbi:MAG: hypothetical protein U0Q11_09580 [Vicinamibacterales bacterium]
MSERIGGTSESGRDGTASTHAAQDHKQPGLFGCLFQPPLPRLLAEPLADPGAQGNMSTGVAGAAAPANQPSAVHAGAVYAASAGGPAAAGAGARPLAPLVAVAAEFSPRFEQHRADLVSMDLRGLARLFGSPRAIGAELRREAASRGLRVHVAIAPTRTAAMVLALTRPGVTVVPYGGVSGALADVPLTVLDQVYEEPRGASGGRGHEQQRADATKAMTALRSWGLRTLGELAALPASDLSARLGRNGRLWQAIARGDDTRPLVPLLADERFEGTLELEWPIEGQEPLSFVLTRLLEPLSTRLERRDRGVAVLHVSLHLVTRDVHECRLELPSPLRDVRALRTLVLLDVESHPPAAAIDAVTITIEPTPGRILQHALFERPHPTPEQLSTLLARLGALMGQDRVGAPAQTDSFRPGAFALTPFALDHRQASAGGGRGAGAANETGTGAGVRAGGEASMLPGTSSPASLFAVAEAGVRASDAGGGGDAGKAISALRRCRQPIPARVATDGHQRPLRVFTDRRGFAGGAVVSCAGPWRTSGAWWEEEEREGRMGSSQPSDEGVRTALRETTGAADASAVARPARTSSGLAGSDAALAGSPSRESGGGRSARREGGGRGPWSRDEWDVALADGAVYRIFRDRTTDGWFIDAVVD